MSIGLLEVSAATRSELGRRSNNEDAVRVAHTVDRCLALLADGAGGHEGGEEASRRAIELLKAALTDPALPFAAASLQRTIQAAHAELQQAQAGAAGTARMHTTVVVLWIDTAGGRALWAHVGDSRLYLVRDGVARALTVDDSVVMSLVAAGLLTSEQAEVHPQKNQLVAALGVEEEVDPHARGEPVYLQEGDAYLLCSDGWWDALDAATIAATLRASNSVDAWLDAMAAGVVAHAAPKQDNYSAIGVWIGDAHDSTWPMALDSGLDTL